MSYWVSLEDANGRTVEVDPHVEGGTYVLGGTTVAELNVTYNYGGLLWDAWPENLVEREKAGDGTLGRMLHGRTGAETAPLLQRAIDALGSTASDPDYWKPTPGNVGRALATLLSWAKQHPEATWCVS